MNNFQAKNSSSNAAKINTYDTVKYSTFITELKRGNLSQEDIASVLGNKHKFKLTYTDDNSFLSKDVNYVPSQNDDSTLAGLFSFD